MKHTLWFPCAVLLFTGCSTVVKYEARTTAGPARPADYPIYVYTEEMKVPRPFEVIGTLHVGDTPLTMKGGTVDGVMETLMQNARQKGADAVQITAIETPGFTSSHYRMDASLIRFTDTWESVALSEEEFLAYLRNPPQPLDPLEGVWLVEDTVRNVIGIVKDKSRPGRDFVAFTLHSANPSWRAGDKKIDVVRGSLRGGYHFDYYLEDYRLKEGAITLGDPPGDAFTMRMPDGSAFIFFTRQ